MNLSQHGSGGLPLAPHSEHSVFHSASSPLGLDVGLLKPYKPHALEPSTLNTRRESQELNLELNLGVGTSASSITQADATSTHTSQPTEAKANIPTTLVVTCGPLKGVLVIAKGKIIVDVGTPDEREVSPTEFERLGGRSATKKWKQSIRVLNEDDTVGRPVGEWLQSAGLDIRANTLSVVPPGPPHKSVPTSSGQPRPAQSRQVPRPIPEQNPEASKAALTAHMQKTYMGYLPGDPTCSLPACLPPMPPSPQGGSSLHSIDLNSYSMEELLVMAKSSHPNPHDLYMSTMLPTHPGVLIGREAYPTGQEPRRRLPQARGRAEALALLGEHLSGKRHDVPWEALGISQPPTVGNRIVDLRKLYSLVDSMGGSDVVSRTRMWTMVAEHMGYNDAGDNLGDIAYTLRLTYQKLLQHFEKQHRAITGFQRRDGTGVAVQGGGSFSRRRSQDGELPQGAADFQTFQRRPSQEAELALQSFHRRRGSPDSNTSHGMAGMQPSAFQHMDPHEGMHQGGGGIMSLDMDSQLELQRRHSYQATANDYGPQRSFAPSLGLVGEDLSSYGTGGQQLLEPDPISISHMTGNAAASASYYDTLDSLGASSSHTLMEQRSMAGLDRGHMHGRHHQGGAGGRSQEDAEAQAMLLQMQVQASSSADYDDQTAHYGPHCGLDGLDPLHAMRGMERQAVMYPPSQHQRMSSACISPPAPQHQPSPSTQSEFALLDSAVHGLGAYGGDASEGTLQYMHQQYYDGPQVPPAGGLSYGAQQQLKRLHEEYEMLRDAAMSKRMAM